VPTPVRGRILAAAALVLAGWTQGCLLFDIAPRRDPLDRLWEEWMLAGHYADSTDGIEHPWSYWDQEIFKHSSPVHRPDRIASSPGGAVDSKYAIRVWTTGGGSGNWTLVGGLIGRADVPGGTIELFVKETVRVHWPTQGAEKGRDYSQDYYLVLRPTATGQGRLITTWHVPPASLKLIPAPDNRYRYSTHGYLAYDPATRVATVTVTGLVTPFQERVDLAPALQDIEAR
jgi:hypothetical protein